MEKFTRGRSPLFLRRELEKELERIFAGMEFQKPGTEERVPLKIYGQNIPKTIHKIEDIGDNSIDYREDEPMDGDLDHCPFCMVKVDKASVAGPEGNVTVSLVAVFGIYDDSETNEGDEDVLNLCWRVYERFAKNPMLADQYTCTGAFEIASQEEDTFPYFFGSIALSFSYAGLRRDINKYV